MRTAVIFDMDGVLVDSEYAFMKRLEGYLRSLKYDIDMDRLAAMAGADDRTIWPILEKVLQTTFDYSNMRQGYDAYLQEHPVIYHDIIFDGIENLLQKLQKKGCVLALASSSRLLHIEQMLDSCGLRSYFSIVLSGEMFERTKPDPAIYCKAIELTACDPSKCIVIEDSTFGITAAKAAGLYTLARRERRFPVDQNMADAGFEDYVEAEQLICERFGFERL